MGDPRKHRKKYKRPLHPWESERLEAEKILLRDYGLKNKTGIWKMDSFLRNLKRNTKRLIREEGKQIDIEKDQFIKKLSNLGLFKGGKLADVLSLDIKDVMERRLQTLVYNKGLARSVSQARQFIVHNHIQVDGKKINAPSYLVSMEEESKIGFITNSSLMNPEHPERVVKKAEIKKEIKEEKKVDEKEEKPKKEVKVEKPKEKVKEEKKVDKKEAPKKEKKIKEEKPKKEVKEDKKVDKKEAPKKEKEVKEEKLKEEIKIEEVKV